MVAILVYTIFALFYPWNQPLKSLPTLFSCCTASGLPQNNHSNLFKLTAWDVIDGLQQWEDFLWRSPVVKCIISVTGTNSPSVTATPEQTLLSPRTITETGIYKVSPHVGPGAVISDVVCWHRVHRCLGKFLLKSWRLPVLSLVTAGRGRPVINPQLTWGMEDGAMIALRNSRKER